MSHPITREVGAIFVPVSDIERSRDWYCRLLGVAEPPPVQFGHLCLVPMRDGSGLVLDAKDFAGPHDRKPVFHFNTDDIPAAFAYMQQMNVDLVGDITDGIFFNFKDPDGNLLMIANVPPAARAQEHFNA